MTTADEIFDETIISEMILSTQCAIKKWAEDNDLWHDTSFKVPHEHYNECPTDGALFLICSEGDLCRVWGGGADDKLEDEFIGVLRRNECWFELETECTVSIYSVDETVAIQIRRYQRFSWIKSLAVKRAFDVHNEVYKHFSENPTDLRKLGWREYEVLLDGIFRNCGFRTELGPGSGDGGVDIRLYQGDIIGELVTLVQAKRYGSRPVGLEAVAALSGIVEATSAHRGLIVTTSRFLPGAQQFARLNTNRIQLAGLGEVGTWCGQISEALARFLESGKLDQSNFLRNHAALHGPAVGSIVYARYGYNCVLNEFCRVIAETRYEVVLEPLETKVVSGNTLVGTEIPLIDGARTSKTARFIAFRSANGFWGNRRHYGKWDGTPLAFDLMD